MRYKQARVVDGETITTWYIGKHFEVEERRDVTNTRHFISDVVIVNLYDSQVPDIRFTHHDWPGSAVTFTDEHNAAALRRFFDPFGELRVGGDWSRWASPGLSAKLMNLPGQETGSYRGFTDHEHLDDAERIHMNGRVYDYNVGRFMSVDPVIQSPTNSQSINPYSYIMNNPLAGTDPTGYCAAATGSNIKDCGDLRVDVEITMKDGSTQSHSIVVKNVNFANGADVSQSISSGAMSAVSQSIADTKSEASKAQNSSKQIAEQQATTPTPNIKTGNNSLNQKKEQIEQDRKLALDYLDAAERALDNPSSIEKYRIRNELKLDPDSKEDIQKIRQQIEKTRQTLQANDIVIMTKENLKKLGDPYFKSVSDEKIEKWMNSVINGEKKGGVEITPAVAFIWPSIKNRIFIVHQNYFSTDRSQLRRVNTLVHEASHHHGTLDRETDGLNSAYDFGEWVSQRQL